MTRLCLILLISLISLLSFATGAEEAQNTQTLFSEATKAYLTKDYKKAQTLYAEVLKIEPQNSIVLTNLALTEYHLGQKFLALGLLRKALHGSPGLEAAEQGLKFVSAQVPNVHNSGEVQFYETLRRTLLTPLPIFAYFLLSALCLFASGWILISYIERRRKALQTESALPTFPWIGALISFLFIIFLSLFALKAYDNHLIRGTIVLEQASLQTAPGENQVAIMDLMGGQEVEVLSEAGDWAQVKAPGKTAGWVKKSALVMTR